MVVLNTEISPCLHSGFCLAGWVAEVARIPPLHQFYTSGSHLSILTPKSVPIPIHAGAEILTTGRCMGPAQYHKAYPEFHLPSALQSWILTRGQGISGPAV